MKWFCFIGLVIFLSFDAFAVSREEIDRVNQMNHNALISNLEQSKKRLLQNQRDARAIGYEQGEAISNQLLSIVYYYLLDYKNGMRSSMRAIRYYERMNLREKVAAVYTDIGYSIRSVNAARALYYFRLALAMNRSESLGPLRAKLFNNYGTLMKDAGKLDSAYYYHHQSLSVCRQYNDTIGMPYSLNNLVVVLSAKKQFDKAFFYLAKSDSIRRRHNNELNWADNLAYRADVYFDMQQTDSAVKYYEQALVLARKTKFMNLTSFCLNRLATLYERMGRPSDALRVVKALKSQEDSIKTLETNRIVASLQEEYLVAQREKKIAEQSLLLQRQRTTTTLIGVGVVVIFLGAGYLFYHFRKKKKMELERLMHAKELEKTRLAKEFAEEKWRISRELHDNIGSQLTFMISSVDNLVFREPQETQKDRLTSISDFGRQTMNELRTTIWAMKNEGGEISELLLKINNLRSNVASVLDVRIHSESVQSVTLAALPMLNLFRIVQEFIQNTVKYAEASQVEVRFGREDDYLVLILQDDGIGFDTTQTAAGNGLSNMRIRAEQCGGSLRLSSIPGKGTTVEVRLPI